VQAYGYTLPAEVEHLYSAVRKTHNAGVFHAYTAEMRAARKSGILTGMCCVCAVSICITVPFFAVLLLLVALLCLP
jgi:uncharacterized membrane protein